jgi:hypothetical protein
MDEKDPLSKRVDQLESKLDDHIEKTDKRLDTLGEAFPNNDAMGHKSYHDRLMQERIRRADFYNKLKLDVVKWATMGTLGWAAYALWAAFLKGPK